MTTRSGQWFHALYIEHLTPFIKNSTYGHPTFAIFPKFPPWDMPHHNNIVYEVLQKNVMGSQVKTTYFCQGA